MWLIALLRYSPTRASGLKPFSGVAPSWLQGWYGRCSRVWPGACSMALVELMEWPFSSIVLQESRLMVQSFLESTVLKNQGLGYGLSQVYPAEV